MELCDQKQKGFIPKERAALTLKYAIAIFNLELELEHGLWNSSELSFIFDC
jgi:hypothetical protein